MAKLTITAVSERVTVRQGADIVACTGEARQLSEGARAPVLYLPIQNALAARHVPTTHRTHCPLKGEAAYFSVGDAKNKAWIYYDPIPAAADIAEHLAYYPDTVEITHDPLPPLADAAADIFQFWFNELPADMHFKQDDKVDAAIRDRFGALHRKAAEGYLTAWMDHPRGALAIIILLDQFSRNLFRGSAEAFAQDAAARVITHQMIERGDDLFLRPDERAFAYLPLMHSEALDDQNQCVELFQDRLPGSVNVAYALSHRQDIHQHGRFPYRDEALGR